MMVRSIDRRGPCWRNSRRRAGPTPSTRTARCQMRALLIFEMGQPGRSGVDLPSRKGEGRMNGRAAGRDRPAGLRRAAGGAALHATQPRN